MHRPVDAHLALQLGPVKQQCGLRVDIKLACLAAAIVREEDKTVFVETLHEHHAGRGLAAAVRRGECHRFRHEQTGIISDSEPLAKEIERVALLRIVRHTQHDSLAEGEGSSEKVDQSHHCRHGAGPVIHRTRGRI